MSVRRCPSIGQGAWSGPAVFHTPTLIVLFYTHEHNANFRISYAETSKWCQSQESITITDHGQLRSVVFFCNGFMISEVNGKSALVMQMRRGVNIKSGVSDSGDGRNRHRIRDAYGRRGDSVAHRAASQPEEVGRQSHEDHPRLRLNRERWQTSEGYHQVARRIENEWADQGIRYREQWSKFELRTLTLIDRLPQLYKDQDLERSNLGITFFFLYLTFKK